MPLAHSCQIGLPSPGCIDRDGELVVLIFELSPLFVQHRGRGLGFSHGYLPLAAIGLTAQAVAALTKTLVVGGAKSKNVGDVRLAIPAAILPVTCCARPRTRNR